MGNEDEDDEDFNDPVGNLGKISIAVTNCFLEFTAIIILYSTFLERKKKKKWIDHEGKHRIGNFTLTIRDFSLRTNSLTNCVIGESYLHLQ